MAVDRAMLLALVAFNLFDRRYALSERTGLGGGPPQRGGRPWSLSASRKTSNFPCENDASIDKLRHHFGRLRTVRVENSGS